MSRSRLGSLVAVSLILAACGGGGLNFWLYPEPRLAPQEEAVFATYESNKLLFLDGEDTGTRCFGDRRMATQGYHRNDVLCRLHIRPGQHTAVFQTGQNNAQRATLDFAAEAGKVYGLKRSGCTTSAIGVQANCRFEVVEVDDLTESGS